MKKILNIRFFPSPLKHLVGCLVSPLLLRRVGLTAIFILLVLSTFGQKTWDGGGDATSWSDPVNWNGNTLPTAGQTVTISRTASATIDVDGNFTCAGLTIALTGNDNGNRTLQLNIPGGNTLTVNGMVNIDNPSTRDARTKTCFINVVGVLNANGGVSMTSTSGINNKVSSLRISGGTVNCTGDIDMNAASPRNDITFTTGTLNVTGNISGGTINEGTGTVNYNGNNPQNVGVYNYYNLTFSGTGTKTLATGNTIQIAADWTNGAPATLAGTASTTIGGNITGSGSITMGSGTIAVIGDFSNTGTFTCGTGTVNYNGNNQQVKGATYYNLTISNGNTKTLQAHAVVNNLLTLSSGVLQIGNNNLTVTNATAIAGSPFSSTKMIATDGTGYFIKNATGPAETLYPVGSGGYYSPATFAITGGGVSGTISVRAVSTTSLGIGFIAKYWDVVSSVAGKTVTTSFSYDQLEGGAASSARFKGAGAWQTPPPTGTVSLGAYSATVTGTTNITTTNTLWSVGTPNTYYSYQSGSWSNPTTWTSDPGGTTQVGSTIPGNNDHIVILSGRTVSLPGNLATTNLNITINEGAFLDMATYQFTAGLAKLDGLGTLKIASSYFPAAVTNNLINAGGGTVEFYNNVNYDLPSQPVYNNLIINKSGAVATQISHISLNGNLHVKNGIFQVNNTTAQRLQLTINGNVTVDAGASITVGTGVTNGITNPVGITGSTLGFLNYYENYSHRITVWGDFTNNGTVRFTNLNYPVFNSFPPTSGAQAGCATVYFKGTGNNTLYCNGITDFYNLILDKGIDQTFRLTVQSTAYNNFRLFGANVSGGENGGANPDIKKALWIRTGTLELKGLVVIPSLTEGAAGGNPVSDYVIPANGALLLNGPDVIVMVTADDYGEVNVAYGVSGTTGASNGVTIGTNPQGLMVYGKLQVNDGYLSARESAGILYNNVTSGQIEINGGVVDAKQLRENGTTGSGTSFSQSAGTFILRGRFVRPVSYGNIAALSNTSGSLSTRAANGTNGNYGTFNINNAGNIYSMSGGTIKIFDVCGTVAPVYALDIRSSGANTNVSGGTVEISPTHAAAGDVTPQLVYSEAAAFANFIINRGAGCASDVQLNTYPLTVLKDLTINSGSLLANNLDITVGGNFTVATTGTYNSGANTTMFKGSANQTFMLNGTVNNGVAGINNMLIDKTSGSLIFDGTQPSLIIQGSFDLNKGTLDDGGKIIYIAGNITNSGFHISTPGTGKIQLNGTSAQTIGGDGNGAFNHLELNNTLVAASPVSLNANISLTGNLTFSQDRIFNIGNYNLRLGENSAIINGGQLRYIQTSGGAGDGGITKKYSASAVSFDFPVGAPTITPARAVKYTPASITVNGAATVYGSITVIPVGYEHPATKVNNVSLTYFWRVKSTGFTLGAATVTHGYTYGQVDMTGVTESECAAARYLPQSYSWTSGSVNDVDENNNIVGEPGTGTFLQNVTFIDGDYTAGDIVGQNPFAVPTVFFSRQSGAWATASTWSYTSHIGPANTGTATPGALDIVVIGGKDSVYFATHNTNINIGQQSCASLQIEQGSALDIGYNPGSSFGMVLSHPNGNGNFRVTTSYNTGSTFAFPSGDFTDFNTNLGTTELYTVNPNAGTTYWLPNGIYQYGNLIISPRGGSNVIFPNNNVNILGNMVIRGQNADSWFCPTWNTNYPTAPNARVSKTITVNGNFDIQGGSFGWYGGNGGGAQNVVVHGDVIVAPLAGIDVWGSNTSQSLSIGGSLINNSTNNIAGGTTTRSYVNLTLVPLTFFGEGNVLITNTAGNPRTDLGTVTVNKGSSQATTLTLNIAGTLNTLANNWLTLQNGTFRYERTGDLSITTTSAFTIPASAGLYINTPSDVNIANSNVNNNDLYLSGKLTIIDGRVFIGRETGADNNNNDIEYSGGGASEIDLQGGTLFVNGQIRRNPATTDGVLKYSQSGNSTVIINGQNRAANTNSALLEVFNDGSSFNMADNSSLTIVRGGGGNTYGDLYLRPQTSNITGGTIIFTQSPSLGAVADDIQNYQIDANIPLNNLTITGKTAATVRNATVKLMVNPLILKGNLTLSNAYSIFDANSVYNIDVTIKGNFTNNGTYNHYNNNTSFTGGVQSINGSSSIDFYNFTVNPVTSLTINKDATVGKDLSLLGGTLACNTYKVTVNGNVINNATYTDNNGGLILTNGTAKHHISGTGTYGQLELNDVFGARIDNDITLQKNLLLTQGIFDINQYLLTLGQNSNILGAGFGASKMITSDGVFSNVGLKKIFPSPASGTFTYPLGTSGKYTPAVLTILSNGSVGSIRVNNINSYHPSVFDPANVLKYYWEVESSGITGFEGSLALNYLEGDVAGGPENTYVAARLLVPSANWSKAASGADNVDEILHKITFSFPAGTSNFNGEYTAGNDPAIPDVVPEFTSVADGDWNSPATWVQTGGDPYVLTGGPNGFIVTINHVVSSNSNNCFSYRTIINNTLRFEGDSYGHNLGTVAGSGKLYLETGILPAGRYIDFFDCATNSTLEFGGIGKSYTFLADLYSSVSNIVFSGTGTRGLPDKTLTICKQLSIDGPTLDNSTYNQRLNILGNMVLNSGAFNSGTGAEAIVSFSGTLPQTMGNFNGSNAFNNLEVNNAAGLTLNGPIDVKGDLFLTNGIIHTSAINILTLTNSSTNCVFPAGGSPASYINGPLTKKLNQGDTYFQYPIGNAATLGNNMSIRATQTGTLYWTAEYINPSALNTYEAPLTTVNEREYWNISTPAGGQAIVNITWNPSSDLTPLMTQYGITDMRVAGHNGTDWTEFASAATGDNYNGSAETNSRVAVSAAGSKFTLACINTPKPRIRFAPIGAVCGNAGIPVTLSTAYAIFGPYTVKYTKNGAESTATPASFPFTLPTDATGAEYRLTEFTYNYPAGVPQTGVFDVIPVTTYTLPSAANAGSPQSLCGATSANLAANVPAVGTGLWSIVSGTGGTVVDPTQANTTFNGTNGSTYTLRWTITNVACSSFSDVTVTFPLLAQQPAIFSSSSNSVCNLQNGVIYTVPNDPSVSYTWTYSGLGAVINGTNNSVTVDFGAAATSGNLSVTATNGCGISAARTIAVTVNARPVPTFTAQGTADICVNTDITYTTQAGQSNYLWTIPGIQGLDYTITAGGIGVASNTVTLKWLTVGSKTVTINYTNPAGCAATTATSSNAIIVNPLPVTGPVYREPNY